MKRFLLFSRLFQFSIVLSFLLPFFFVGCEKSDESVTAADTTIAVDTLQVVPSDSTTYSSDSLSTRITETEDSIQTTNIETIEENKKESTFSEELIVEHEWLSPFLMPDRGVFTGLGLIVNVIRQSIFFNIIFSFVLLLIGLSIKFLEKSAVKSQILLNVLSLILLFLYTPDIFSVQRLWGFGVCISLLVFTIAIDVNRLLSTYTKNNS